MLHFKNPNKKYVNKDGYEVVLDNENKPVYDSAIIGTYNFYTYESPLEEIKDWYNHLEDVQLWRKFGTGPNDPTTKEQREKLGGAFSAKILFITYPLIELDSKIKNKKDYSYDEINNLKEIRKEKGYSQTDLAELVGVSRNTISSIETGQFNPTAKLALILCIALDKKFEEIFYFD